MDRRSFLGALLVSLLGWCGFGCQTRRESETLGRRPNGNPPRETQLAPRFEDDPDRAICPPGGFLISHGQRPLGAGWHRFEAEFAVAQKNEPLVSLWRHGRMQPFRAFDDAGRFCLVRPVLLHQKPGEVWFIYDCLEV